ncbi:MAG: NAD(P)/FAD-dependent oxidoreductase [Promethearchaeota archaeon]|nr:MAG: NAD(P)/FAD-dependent oxidoreductase [Candidatus Lokiarchaeota archaeon]
MTKFVIVGNGVAGVNAADTIRREDSEGTIEIYTDEQYLTYARPKLPSYIAEITEFEELFTRKWDWYKDKNINLFLESKVIEIYPKEKKIELENGEKISYDKLLLAAGSHPSIPPIKGTDKNRVKTLRTIDDSNEIIEIVEKTEKVIVIGGGLLGIETANSINMKDNEVTIVEFFPRLLPKQLDEEGAMILQNILEKKGMKIVVGAVTEEILGKKAVTGVRLKDGREFPAGCVVISAGIRPNLQLAKKCDIKINRGIIVNKYMETNYEDIYAAGDIAEFKERVWGIIPVAFAQSKVAGINMVHNRMEIYEEVVPSNTLKVTDIDLMSTGKIHFDETPDDIIEKRVTDEKNGIYKKLVVQKEDNKLIPIGAILLGDKTNSFEIQKLIKNEIDVRDFLDEILKPNIDLKKYLS